MDSSTQKPRFLADQMLGRLSKWLRILGFDTKYFNSIEDSELLKIAKDENRILLTRDTQLLKRRPVVRNHISAILIDNDHIDNQLNQLINNLDLEKNEVSVPLCAECNIPIQKIPKNSVCGKVPSYVFKTQNEFGTCPNCGRFFWKGTHWERIRQKLQAILNTK
jgi:uncharacterized protein with PIN domain